MKGIKYNNLTYVAGEWTYILLPTKSYMRRLHGGNKKYHCYFILTRISTKEFEEFCELHTMMLWKRQWDNFMDGLKHKEWTAIYKEEMRFNTLERRMTEQGISYWCWTGDNKKGVLQKDILFLGTRNNRLPSNIVADYKHRWSELPAGDVSKIVGHTNLIPVLIRKYMFVKLSNSELK